MLVVPSTIKSLPLIVTIAGTGMLIVLLGYLTEKAINRKAHRALTLQ